MLVNSSLSARALVASSVNVVERKKLLRVDSLCISLWLRKKTERSWEAVEPSCLVIEVNLYSAQFALEMCILVEESISIFCKECIIPRLSWPVPALLPYWMADQPLAALGCCHHCPDISFFRGIAWHSFSCSDGGKAISLLPWRPLKQLCFVPVPPESLSLGKQMPRWGHAE